jgi:hypothetical protein
MANLALQRLARATAAMRGESVIASGETNLREIIDDPMTHRLMASDRVDHDHLIRLLGEARSKLARRPR